MFQDQRSSPFLFCKSTR